MRLDKMVCASEARVSKSGKALLSAKRRAWGTKTMWFPPIRSRTYRSVVYVKQKGYPPLTVNNRSFVRNVSTYVLWILVVVYAVVKLVNPVLPLHIPTPLVILIPIVFGLLHGALRYKWSGILTFLVICLVVSNLLENTSILTGFPFGHYYYTSGLGPKLFLVPLVIGPAYFGTGYLAWVLSTVLIGDVRPEASAFTTFAVPFMASFMMVAWDLGIEIRPAQRSGISGSGSKAVATLACRSQTTWGGSSRCMSSSNSLPSTCVCARRAVMGRSRRCPGPTMLRPS